MITLLALLVACFLAAAQPPAPRIWTPPAVQKILQDDPWPPESTCPEIRLNACRGETEWGQIVLRSDRPCDVKAQARPWEPLSVHGRAPALPETALHVAHYVLVDRPSGNRVQRPARWPDPLPGGNTARLQPGRNQAFYVRVSVPAGCRPGLYRSSVRVHSGGARIAEVPLRLHVWDIELPAVPTMRTSYYVWWDGIRNRYKLGARLEHLERFFWFLVERRLCPMVLPVEITDPRADRYMADLRVNGVRVPFRDPVELRRMIEHVRRKGWLGRTYIYLYDEPARRDWNKIHEASDLITSIEPRMARLDSIQPEPELLGKVSIWCPNVEAAYLYRDRIAPRQQAGDQVWWYTCCVPKYPYPTFLLDDDAVAPRMLFWMQALYGMTGSMYINTIHWGPDGWDPWDKSVISMEDQSNNGDGLLMYSGREPDGCYPVTSVRLEAIQDGIEDWELLNLLRQTAARAAGAVGAPNPTALASEWATGLASQVMPEARQPDRNPYRLLRARLWVLESILRLRRDPQHVYWVPAPRREQPGGDTDPGKFMHCPRLPAAPQVDGDLSDPCWNQVTAANRPGNRTVVTRFRNLTGRIWPSENTVLVSGWRGGTVYLAAACQEPEAAKLVTTGPIGEADHMWFEFAGGRRLTISAGGSAITQGNWGDMTPSAAVGCDKDGYTVEVAVPGPALGIGQMAPGAEGRINFGRWAAPGKEQLTWVSRFGPRQSPRLPGTMILRD